MRIEQVIVMHAAIMIVGICGCVSNEAMGQQAISSLNQYGGVVGTLRTEDGVSGVSVSLDYVRRPSCEWMPVVLAIPTILELDLRGGPISDEILETLIRHPALSNLRALNISRTHVTSVGISKVRHLGSLRSLSLAGLKLGEKLGKPMERSASVLAPLFECRMLEDLDVSGNYLTDNDIEGIKALQLLRRLRLKDNRELSDQTILEVTALPQLRELDVDGCWGVSDDGIVEMARLMLERHRREQDTGLTSLVISRTRVGIRGIRDGVARLPKLKRLDYLFAPFGVPDDDQALGEIVKLTQLESLRIGGYKHSTANLRRISELRNLRTLSVLATSVSDEVLLEYKALRRLRILSLFMSRNVSNRGIEQLGGLPDLEVLNLGGLDRISDRTANVLATFPRLQQIELMGTRITDAGLQRIAGMKGVTHLDLMSTKVTGSGLLELKRLPGLRTLFISDIDVGDNDLATLAALPSLTNLHLSGKRVTDTGILRLQEMKQLRRLDLGPTAVSPDGLQRLFDRMPWCDNGQVERIER